MTESIKKPPDLFNRTLINGFSALILAVFIFFAEFRFFRVFFTGFVAMISAITVYEFYNLAKRKNLAPAMLLGMLAAVFYTFAVYLKTVGPPLVDPFWQHFPEVILGLTLLGCFIFYAATNQPSIANIATTFFGVVYIAIPLGLIIRIVYFFTFGGREDPAFYGSFWLLYLIVVTKSADMGGYFVGSYFGKRKLATRVSPNKTMEGAIGGLIASIALSLFLCWIGKITSHFEEFTYAEALWLGGLVGIVGQIGDLAESLLKRDAGVKDSNKLPGVGGLLDMVDSLLFTAPLLYIFLRIEYT